MNEALEIDLSCKYCGKSFRRQSTIDKHLCESKKRYLDKDKPANRIGYQVWVDFYKKNTNSKKTKTYLDFTKSTYYLVFVKFASYCIAIKCVDIFKYVDWLLENQYRVDIWSTDSLYDRFLIHYLKHEDPSEAIARSIETTIHLAENESILAKDVLRYGNKNRICHNIVNGKISPWMLYHSESGIQFLESLDMASQKLIMDYINPEQWAIKFKRETKNVHTVKDLLKMGGY